MKRNAAIALLTACLLLLTGCATPLMPLLPELLPPAEELRAVSGPEDILALFTGGEPAETPDTVDVYRLAADGQSGELIRAEPMLPPGEEPELDWLVAAFCAPSRTDGLVCALPEGVVVESCRLENAVATLELSESFLALSDMRRTVTAFCAVLTLCQLEPVEAVTVTAGGQTVFAGLMPEDAILTDTDTDPYVRQLRLYFPDGEGRYLVSEYHSLTLDEDTSPERYVIEELMRGPNNGELQSVIPAGTALRSCVTEDGVCTVDFSSAFLDNRPRTALGERLVIYAVVNSLTALSGVGSVRITVEGRPVDTYVYRTLAEPLFWYDEAVGPVSLPKGETDADLYLPMPDLTHITPLPFRIAGAEGVSGAEAALAALFAAEEPGYPKLLPDIGAVSDVTALGSVCAIDLTEGFFASIPAEARAAAVGAMAATVCALPGISSVRFTLGGGDAVFDGVDWSGPWRNFDEIEVS